MYQTQRLYISNCLCLWFLLLIYIFLCYFMLPSLRLDNSVHIIYNYSYHLQRFNISQKNIFLHSLTMP